jgi:hypothetical protein
MMTVAERLQVVERVRAAEPLGEPMVRVGRAGLAALAALDPLASRLTR